MNLGKKIITLLIGVSFVLPYIVFAQATPNNINDAIAEKNKQIEELERQINEYQNQIDSVSSQARSLNQEVSTLRSSEKILETSVRATNTKLHKTSYTIEKNINEIQDLNKDIFQNRDVIAQSLRLISMNDERSPIELFLRRKQTLSGYLQDYQDVS